MPIRPVQISYPDVAGAQAAGGRNALAQAKMMQAGQQFQQQNVLAPLKQREAELGIEGAELGLESKEMANQLQGLKYVAGTAPRISDQATYDAAVFDWQEKGLVNPGELPEQYSADIVTRLAGGAAKKVQDFTLSPGQVRFGAGGEQIAAVPAKPEKIKPVELTPGQKKVDETFAKEYSGYVAAGGFADINKQMNQLRGVHRQLQVTAGEIKPEDLAEGEEAINLTGPGLSMLPDYVLARTNPEAMAARDAVEEVVQRNLRLVLGAQFTEKEGERLIARAYNPALGEKENAKRVGRLIGQITQAAKAKQRASDYYEKNGTLKGFKGKLWTAADFGIKPAPEQAGVRAYNPATGRIE